MRLKLIKILRIVQAARIEAILIKTKCVLTWYYAFWSFILWKWWWALGCWFLGSFIDIWVRKYKNYVYLVHCIMFDSTLKLKFTTWQVTLSHRFVKVNSDEINAYLPRLSIKIYLILLPGPSLRSLCRDEVIQFTSSGTLPQSPPRFQLP